MPPRPSLHLAAVALVAAAACKSATSGKGAAGAPCRTDADCATALLCTDAPAGKPATPGKPQCAPPARAYTFRALAGVSMGAVGTSRLAAAHPDKLDAAGMLGGPLDATLLLRTLETSYLGGFCPRAQLEAALALDLADGGDRLDRPDGVPGCTQAPAAPLTRYSYANRFDKWHFTTNGGRFDRDFSLDIFFDLMLALGNPLSTDPAQPGAVPPLTPQQLAAATCEQPAVVEHYVDARYSPHGEHRAITFCDGEPPLALCADGALVDWCAAAGLFGRKLAQRSDADAFCAAHGGGAHDADQINDADAFYAHHGELRGCWPGSKQVSFALALDLNRNGRRDLHEPVVFAAREPWQDVGSDGCPDPLEDGKGGCTTAELSPFSRGVKDPNGDDYDALTNPGGTEGNLRWDPGEPFDDVGLDGAAGSGDFGEGDGKYSVAPGLQRWLDGDLRLSLPRMSEAQRRALDLYFDGGIRDVFDLGAQAEAAAGGALLAMPDGLNAFADFTAIPPPGGGAWPGGQYDPQRIDVRALGRNALVNYGSTGPTPAQLRAGDGDHVGTVGQVYDRFLTFFRWLSARWDAPAPARVAHGQGAARSIRYASTVLGADREFMVTLPPGYDDPANAQVRYPVLFLLHGYGQSPSDFSSTSVFVDLLTNLGQMRELIIVYPDGRCCYRGPNGERACTEKDASGTPWTQRGYVRACARGSFFVDPPDPTAPQYGSALFELMDEVDRRFRTLPPAVGPAF